MDLNSLLTKRRLLDACDIRIVGCCRGTSPEHMAAVAEQLREA